jgi:hypothetical protein
MLELILIGAGIQIVDQSPRRGKVSDKADRKHRGGFFWSGIACAFGSWVIGSEEEWVSEGD